MQWMLQKIQNGGIKWKNPLKSFLYAREIVYQIITIENAGVWTAFKNDNILIQKIKKKLF